MKKQLTLLLFAVFLGFAAHAQLAKEIIGTWKLSRIVESHGSDNAKPLENMLVTFKPDNTYTTQIAGKTERGTWSIDYKESVIELAGPGGQLNKLKVTKLEGKELNIDFSQLSLLLVREGGDG